MTLTAPRRTRSHFVLAFTLAAVFLLLVPALAVADSEAKVNPMKHCHDDFRTLCVDKMGVDAKTGDLWSCMRESVSSIKDDVCRSWIEGMIACEDDAKKVPGCISDAVDSTTALRRCLRGLEDDKLSPKCIQSGFLQRLRAARPAAQKE